MATPDDRCRLVLCVPLPEVSDAQVLLALEGGDVSSVIFYDADGAPTDFITRCKALVPQIQDADIATIITADTQAFGRSDADGFLVSGSDHEIKDAIARFSPQKIVGCAGIRERHRALVIGEFNPDFVFFGKPGGDTHAVPHKKYTALGEWWAQLVEIPSVVMAGNEISSVVEVAKCGVEFVGLGRAVFNYGDGPKSAIEAANKLLDEHAPVFE